MQEGIHGRYKQRLQCVVGKDMWRAHEKLIRQQGLNDHHFDVIVKHLVGALQEAGVPEVTVLALLYPS